ncbi:MAG: trypsin-like peptidase domain-containing protein [Planctomycetaceae bacterium]|jgi:serine protease Do|nr:trypsin-like peptidase domain-containing protein [Planctomycetaceae bacterium]
MKVHSLLIIPVFAVCWVLTAICSADTRENWATDAYRKNCDSVVFIQGDKIEETAARSERTFNGMGTGIIIDERGYIVTNYHVVKDIRKIQVTTRDQKQYTAVIAVKDADTDLALIKIVPRVPLRPITFGRSHDLMPGESCIAIGNPYGYAFSLTDGRISAVNREVGVNESSLVYRLAIQTNTEINPGNSGGPLINVDGEMIGINVAIRQGAAGIAFAIPVDLVMVTAAKMFGEMVDQHLVHGITATQIENESSRFSVIAEAVESGSPAETAGIRQGDIISQIGKYAIKNKLDFYRALLGLKTGDEIAFTVQRQQETLDIAVALDSKNSRPPFNKMITARPAAAEPKTASQAATPKSGTMTAAALDELVWENLGIRYEPLPLKDYERMFPEFMQAFPDGGVMVKSVREDSPMARGQVTAGDVIVGIGNWVTTSNNDVRYIGKIWSTLQTKNDKIRINVFRENKHYYSEVPLK